MTSAMNRHNQRKTSPSGIHAQLSSLRSSRGRTLVLNDSLGFSEKDLTFLDELTWLEKIVIVSDRKFDFSPLYTLVNLKTLHTSNLRDFDLSRLPNLRDFSGTWHESLNLSGCHKLNKLALQAYQGTSLEKLTPCRHLQYLGLVARNLRSLEGLAHKELLSMKAAYCRDKLSLVEIGAAPNLVEVTFDHCKQLTHTRFFSHLQYLAQLRLFDIKTPIDSVGFVSQMPQLLSFSCIGTKILDGNLHPLSKLKWIGIENRRHYSLTESQLHATAKARGGGAFVSAGDYDILESDINLRRKQVAKQAGFKISI